MRGWAPFWRPNLAYGYTFLARQEPKKSCIGNKDLAPFWRFCCGLLILIVKDEEFVLVNHGRTVITFTPGSYVLYVPKNRFWGPKNGPGAVSRRPETPRNSRTLRDRSRDAFFVIVIAPGPMLFFGPFNACVLSVILMNWCAFGARYDWLIVTLAVLLCLFCQATVGLSQHDMFNRFLLGEPLMIMNN